MKLQFGLLWIEDSYSQQEELAKLKDELTEYKNLTKPLDGYNKKNEKLKEECKFLTNMINKLKKT